MTTGDDPAGPAAGGGERTVAVILCTCRPPGAMLAEAVDSVRNQTFGDWRLLVVDDGSPDPERLDAFARAHGDLAVVHQANQGLCVARNVGLAHTRSRYVAFLDDDDVWMPEKLERQVKVLEDHPDAVACHCQFEVFSEDGTTTKGAAGPYDFGQLLRSERFSLFPTMLVRRSDLDACGWFSSNFPTAEDVDLTYRLARRGPILFCDEVLFRYRRHEANVTNDLRANSLASLMALDLQHARQLVVDDRAGAADSRRGRRAMARYWVTNDLLGVAKLWRTGRRQDALHLASWLLRTFPKETLAVVAGRTAGNLLGRPAPGKPPTDHGRAQDDLR